MIRLCIATFIVLTTPLVAQWVHYPTPGIPRTADGKPNLAAPAPRTANGKPDFSGFWEKRADKYYNNIAADLKPGDVQPWAEALYQERKKDFGKNSMEAQCLPMGPAYSTTPYRESKMIQTPTMLVILNEDLTFRQIYMDGRELEKDPNPSWMGYAVGHWDGDTLVVDTIGFNDKLLDERQAAVTTTSRLSVEHHVVPVRDKDITDNFLNSIWHSEIPGIIPTVPPNSSCRGRCAAT